MIEQYEGFELDDTLSRVDFAHVHAWLTQTYWSPGISRERVEKGARHSSLVIGAYHNGRQAGYMRVVSDRTRFAYVADVYIAEEHRRRGLAKAMVRFALRHPDHQEISRWMLATKDAHAVYKAVGFEGLAHPEVYMVLQGRDGSSQAGKLN